MGAAQFVSALFGVVYSILAARGLGPAPRGQLFVIQAYAGVAALLVGLSTSTIMTVQLSREQFDFAEVHTAALLQSLLFGGIGGGGTLWLYLYTTHLTGPSFGMLAAYFLSMPALIYKANWSGLFLGIRRVGVISIVTVLDAFLMSVGAVVTLFVLRAGLDGMLLMMTLETAVIAAIGVYLSFKQDRRWWRWSTKCNVDLLQRGWKQHVATTVTQLYYRADAFILAHFLSPASLGEYAVARGLSDRITLAFTPFAQVMFPHISSDDAERSRKFTQATFRQLAGLGILLATLMIVFLPWFIPLLYGNAYGGAILLAQILCVALIVRAITVPLELWFVGGLLRPGFNALTSIFMLVVVVPLGIFFTMHWAAVGMAVALLISLIATMALTIWLANANDLRLRRLLPATSDLMQVVSEIKNFRISS